MPQPLLPLNLALLVGFGILGGIFSEGIDLTANRLIGVGIVSVGLPGLSTENDLLRDYFDSQGEPGFDYAYQLPGLNHVLQAAGRLIRSASDTGVILLMDQRFASQRYTRYFPPHWQYHRVLHTANELAPTIEQFWEMTIKLIRRNINRETKLTLELEKTLYETCLEAGSIAVEEVTMPDDQVSWIL